MLGYVTVEVEGNNMEGASRHAQRLVNNFLEDLDTMNRTSRNRDRRALSHFETNFETTPQVVHTTFNRRTPIRSIRLGSMPPSHMNEKAVTSSTYRSSISNSEYGLPPAVPRNFYRTYRYTSDSPFSTTKFIDVARPYTSDYHTVTERPLSRHSYISPSIATRRYSATPHSYTSYLPEVTNYRRRIERNFDDIMDYTLPPPEYYRDMRGSLRALNQKLDTHRRMLDRYSGIDMNALTTPVFDRIESKCREVSSRDLRLPDFVPCRSRGPALNTSELETKLYYNSPHTTLGYGKDLVQPNGSQTSELRGRIKRLLCRTRRDPHYYRYLPSNEAPI